MPCQIQLPELIQQTQQQRQRSPRSEPRPDGHDFLQRRKLTWRLVQSPRPLIQLVQPSISAALNPSPATPAPPPTPASQEPSAPAPAEESEKEEDAEIGAAGTGAVVDMEVFGQLLEIVSRARARAGGGLTGAWERQDDDDTHEFSKTLAFDYISQANTTFTEIEDALFVPPCRPRQLNH